MRQLKNNTQLLSMCSSRNRPECCKRMIESYLLTSKGNSQLAIYISTDDPKLQGYKKIIQQFKENVHFHVGPHKYMLHVLNYFSTQIYPNIKYYHQINDDHICITQGWDIQLMNSIQNMGGWGISYPNSTIDDNTSSYMISGNIVRAIGYFVPKQLRHTWGDDWTKKLGQALNSIIWCKDVIIQHRCWHDTVHGIGTRRPWDQNMRFVYGQEQWAFGCQAMKQYNDAGQFIEDVKKINSLRQK